MRTGASFLEPTHLIDAPEIALPSDAETTVPVIPGPSAKREGQQPEMGTTASKTIVARPITSGLTAEFRGRPPAFQHAGAQDLFEHAADSPAAEHFIDRGPLQRFVMRQVAPPD